MAGLLALPEVTVGRHNRSQRRIAIVNGSIFTSDPDQPWAQAVGVAGDRISVVGSTDAVLRASEDAEVVDVAGRTVLPGFVDAHNHFLATGESLGSLDVRFPGVRSIAGLVSAIARACRSRAPGEMVRAHGYDDAKYERPPTRWDLDTAAPSHPVLVGHVSGHYVLANSQAMERRNVSESAVDPPGGLLDRDLQGRLTGVFRDAATALVEPTVVDIGRHGPNFHVAATTGELVAAVERAGIAFLEAGLTTVCDAQVTSRELAAYREARRQGRLPLRTVCMPLSHQIESYETLGLSGPFGDEWLSIGAMKFYCDGSLIGGTAAFTVPYGKQGELEGVLFWEPEDLAAAIERAHGNGWQVGVHAQGDRAIGIVLDAFEGALRTHPRDDPRFRVEHGGYPTDDQLARMRDLGAFLVAQPSYLRDSGDDFLERLPGRAHRLEPLRTALELGVPVVLSSDSDVASFRPMDTIASAIQRETLSGSFLGVDQALTVEEAVRSHTIEAARAIRAEERLGSIEAGKLADIVVIDGDLFGSAPEEIRELAIGMTMIGGRIAHHRF